jgi:putative transposase
MLWFFDPLLKQYYKIPVANQAFPAASVWEFQAAKKKAVDEGHANVNEALIKRYILENRELVNHSESTTKKARRQAQRQRVHSKGSTPANPTPKPVQTATPLPIEFSDLISGDLDDFGDIS